MWHTLRVRSVPPPRPTLATRARAAATAVRLGAIGPRPPAPGSRARLGGPRHSRSRDRAAISHHYDFSAGFYERLLDPSMAYSCGYWTSRDRGYGLADAQRDKLELICRKLALVPGARLLDLGCGWGALALYAADRYGAQVTAVTLAREEHDFLAERVRELGLGERGSGKALLERHIAGRPGFAAYVARTSGFFPRPRRRVSRGGGLV